MFLCKYFLEMIILIIRAAKNEDINDIIKLLRQVADIHYEGRMDLFKDNSSKYNEKQLREILDDVDRPVFVAVDDNENVIGYVFCVFRQFFDDNILTNVKTLYIDDLCVEQDSRGRNIGKKIFDFVLNFAKLNDCYNITLNVWSCNEAAKKFYEKCGMLPQKICMEMIL